MDKATAGAAALSICESLLISLQDLKIISAKEANAVLMDAAAPHRNAIAVSPNADEHRAIAELIEFFIDRKNSDLPIEKATASAGPSTPRLRLAAPKRGKTKKRGTRATRTRR